MKVTQNLSSMLHVLVYTLSAVLATLADSSEISASETPTFNLPEGTNNIQLSGFNKAIISSQAGDRYSPNTYCDLTISVRGTTSIRFTVLELNMPAPTSGGTCEDSVQLYNIISGIKYPLTGLLCGSTLPVTPFVSNSSLVSLVFQTNQYQQSTGFKILYERGSDISAAENLVESSAAENLAESSACTGSGCTSGSTAAQSQFGIVFLFSLLAMLVFH